jgi:hypothetical protein
VDLTRILVPGRPEVYHVAPFLDWPTEEEKPKEGEAVVPIRLAAGQPAVFQTSDKVQIHLRSDANDAFRGERDAVVIYVGGDERVRLLADRHTTAHLVRLGERGDLQLALKTEDHAVIFDPQEKNKELRVSAAIVFGERTVCSSTPVTLIMDSEPPQLGPARFEQPLEKGSKGSVQVPVVDVSPIVEARYAFADLPPRQMDDTNSTRAIPTVVGRNLLSVGVDASKLEIGKHILWLQVRDQAKWNSDIRSVEFEVAAPRKEVILGTVQGAIYVGTTQNRVNGIHFQNNVALWQGDQRMDHPVEVRSDGTFVIRKLPPGKYTLKAQGTVNNLPAVGEDTKELKFENPARTETWTIGVSRPK